MKASVVMQQNFRSTEFLIKHIKSILAFYDPVCVDEKGGFFQYFRNDGSVYDQHSRHLVSSTRFVFNYAQAGRWFNRTDYLQRAAHGLDYLHAQHFQSFTQSYVWTLERNQVTDATNHCYGLAFVLLAHAVAYRAEVDAHTKLDIKAHIGATFDLMERHFWDSEYELYRDEANADFSVIDDYRGQNANMHTCEALIACYQATADEKYLLRAKTLAQRMTVQQAALADGLIWEHYNKQWQPNWDYNKDNPKHLFRPWGFQPGHQTEWSKLLLQLHAICKEDWLLVRARELFDRALQTAWDDKHGGIFYGFDLDGNICDSDKYFWVQAESFAAAARLAIVIGDDQYWQWYDKIWHYCWHHMVDHQYGAWYRILSADNQSYDNLKSPAGKTDYHTMGACMDVLEVLGVSTPV